MKVIVFGGAPIRDYAFCEEYLAGADAIICCDAGMGHAKALGIDPDYIVGDFDSTTSDVLEYYKAKNIPIRQFPTRKDETDMELGIFLALELGATDVIDVSKYDLKEKLCELIGSEKKIDVFYDCVGEKGTVLNNILALARRGTRIVVIGVLQKVFNIPLLPDFVQHELSLSGTTMYVPQDYHDMIDFMGKKVIRTDGMVSHHCTLEKVPQMLEDIVNRRIQTFKVIIDVND